MPSGGFITEGTEDTENFAEDSGMNASARRSSMPAMSSASSAPSVPSVPSVMRHPDN